MASSDCQIDKPQHGCPKRAELLDVNINTGVQSINTERASLIHPYLVRGSPLPMETLKEVPLETFQSALF